MEPIAYFPHLWIVALIAVILLAIGIFLIWLDQDSYDGLAKMFGWFAVVIGAIVAVVSIFLFMPYDIKYHQFYRVSGTIETVSNKFIDGSGELTGRTVIYLEGDDTPYVTSSSRLTSLQGADVDLTCTIAWEPYGLDTIYCGLASINER